MRRRLVAAAISSTASFPPGQPELREQPVHPARQAIGRLTAALAQRLGRGAESALRGRAPGAERPQIHVRRVQEIELRGGLVARGEHRLHRRAVLLGEPEDEVAPALDLRQALRDPPAPPPRTPPASRASSERLA